jgi:hypothetical protein
MAVSVGWPHRPEDMDALLTLGQGYLANDEIGRPIGSGMVFAHSPELAMIGMMMTHPKLQAGGLGDHILTALMADAGTARLRLNATRAAHRLYRNAGFVDQGVVHQYQGILRGALPAQGAGIRPATAADFAALAELDLATFGAPRPALLDWLWRVSTSVVLTQQGTVTGFAMASRFGRGQVIGPLSAPSEGEAIALIAHLAAPFEGRFVRLDADARHTELGAALNAHGLLTYDRVFPMTRGGASGPEAAPDRVYALASHTLG